MELNTKIAIADKLASAYKNSFKYIDLNLEADRKKAFGVIINTPDKNGECMSDRLDEEIAVHITNLTLKKLCDAVSVDIEW